jgi:hypothetical protein
LNPEVFSNVPLLVLALLAAPLSAAMSHAFIGEICDRIFARPFVFKTVSRRSAMEYFRRLFLNVYVCNTMVMLSVIITRPIIGNTPIIGSAIFETSITMMIIALSIRAIAVIFSDWGQYIIRPLILWINLSFVIMTFMSILYPDTIRHVISDKSGGSSAVYWDIIFTMPMLSALLLMFIDAMGFAKSFSLRCRDRMFSWMRQQDHRAGAAQPLNSDRTLRPLTYEYD